VACAAVARAAVTWGAVIWAAVTWAAGVWPAVAGRPADAVRLWTDVPHAAIPSPSAVAPATAERLT
jgi:hypothetical protein